MLHSNKSLIQMDCHVLNIFEDSTGIVLSHIYCPIQIKFRSQTLSSTLRYRWSASLQGKYLDQGYRDNRDDNWNCNSFYLTSEPMLLKPAFFSPCDKGHWGDGTKTRVWIPFCYKLAMLFKENTPYLKEYNLFLVYEWKSSTCSKVLLNLSFSHEIKTLYSKLST